MEKEYAVELQYFKDSGKFYSEGEYTTKKQSYYDIIQEVRSLKYNRQLPGITGNEFEVYIKVENHPDYCPIIIRN